MKCAVARSHTRWVRACAVVAAAASGSSVATAQPMPEPPVASPPASSAAEPASVAPLPPAPGPVVVRPPPINVEYLQFGVAFTGAFSINPGAICPKDATVPCILGSGLGVTARAGHRSRGPWYVGGAYGFDRVDTSSLMRMGVLQQVRAEMRYYLTLGARIEPYFSAAAGGVAFGNEWGTEALGLTSAGGLGFEVQLSRTTVVGASFLYRPVLLFGWTDGAGQQRDTGIAHYLGLDLIMEAREPMGSH